MDKNQKLYRSVENRMLGGVCAGIGTYFGIDATLVRVIYVLASLVTGGFLGLILYIVCLFIVPNDPGYTDI